MARHKFSGRIFIMLKRSLNKLRYPIENGKAVIEIQVDDVQQLFDERDPAPFREKDLDDDAAEYLVLAAQEIGHQRVGKIRIIIGKGDGSIDPQIIIKAVNSFFAYESDLAARKIGLILRNGFKSLGIGLVFLTSSVLASLLFFKSSTFLNLFAKEGLLLMGWVSMWTPINIFLYEWWPPAEQRKVYNQLAKMDIEIVFKQQLSAVGVNK